MLILIYLPFPHRFSLKTCSFHHRWHFLRPWQQLQDKHSTFLDFSLNRDLQCKKNIKTNDAKCNETENWAEETVRDGVTRLFVVILVVDVCVPFPEYVVTFISVTQNNFIRGLRVHWQGCVSWIESMDLLWSQRDMSDRSSLRLALLALSAYSLCSSLYLDSDHLVFFWVKDKYYVSMTWITGRSESLFFFGLSCIAKVWLSWLKVSILKLSLPLFSKKEEEGKELETKHGHEMQSQS